MPSEIFLSPMEGAGTLADPFRGAYTSGDASIVRSGSIRNSRQDVAIVFIEADQSWLDTAAADPDVTRLATESNLDSVLTVGQANAAKSVFEGLLIPGEFIEAGDTRRQAIRKVVGLFLFSQRMEGRFGNGQSLKARAQAQGLNFNSQWNTFPQALKDEFIAIRDDHGWTTQQLGVTATSTLREIMQAISQQYESTPVFIASFEL